MPERGRLRRRDGVLRRSCHVESATLYAGCPCVRNRCGRQPRHFMNGDSTDPRGRRSHRCTISSQGRSGSGEPNALPRGRRAFNARRPVRIPGGCSALLRPRWCRWPPWPDPPDREGAVSLPFTGKSCVGGHGDRIDAGASVGRRVLGRRHGDHRRGSGTDGPRDATVSFSTAGQADGPGRVRLDGLVDRQDDPGAVCVF